MKRLLRLLAFVYVIFVAACASGSTPTSLSTPTAPILSPTPTPPGQIIPGGTVLFQADWSHGLASWSGAGGWKIVNGMPQSDLRENNTLIAPYTLNVANYAYEYRFQVVSVPKNGGFLVVRAKRTQDRNGYVAGILGLLGPSEHSVFANPEIQVYLDPNEAADSPNYPSDYEPGTVWHTFRVEVRGPEVSLVADGTTRGRVTSTQTNWLSNEPLLVSSGAVVRLSSVRIIAL